MATKEQFHCKVALANTRAVVYRGQAFHDFYVALKDCIGKISKPHGPEQVSYFLTQCGSDYACTMRGQFYSDKYICRIATNLGISIRFSDSNVTYGSLVVRIITK